MCCVMKLSTSRTILAVDDARRLHGVHDAVGAAENDGEVAVDGHATTAGAHDDTSASVHG
jgi:hypothetical protein